MAKPASDDWRRQGQERYLQGRAFLRRRYRASRPGWEHDHCEFCGVKFMEQPRPGVLVEGYVTDDAERWVCPQCFEDFRAEFGLEIREPRP